MAAAPSATDADSIVRFLLTSGSTGHPKAVITTNRMCCSNAAMLRQSMPFLASEPPVLLDWLPWNHTFGGSHNLGLVLATAASLYIDDGRPTPTGIAETLRNLREISPTVYFNVPKGFEMLAPHLRDDAAAARRRSIGDCARTSSPARRWRNTPGTCSMPHRCASGAAATPMLSGLGATETGPSVTFTTPQMGRSGVIGLPAAGTLVKLAPVDDKLEIRVRGPAVTPGYWRQPELTAQAFDEEGFYRLGDAVRLIDPEDPTRGLRFDGRIGEDFKLANGTWVSVGPLRAELIAVAVATGAGCRDRGSGCRFRHGHGDSRSSPRARRCSSLRGARRPARISRSDPRLVANLRERLASHARANPGQHALRAHVRCCCRSRRRSTAARSPTRVRSISARYCTHHADLVTQLYSAAPPAHVAVIEPE